MGNVDLLSLSKGTLVSDTHKAAWGWRGWVRAWGFCRLFVRNRRFFALRCQQFTGDRATTIFQKIGKNLLHKFRMLMACNQRLGMQGFNKALGMWGSSSDRTTWRTGWTFAALTPWNPILSLRRNTKLPNLWQKWTKQPHCTSAAFGFTVSPHPVWCPKKTTKMKPKMSQLLWWNRNLPKMMTFMTFLFQMFVEKMWHVVFFYMRSQGWMFRCWKGQILPMLTSCCQICCFSVDLVTLGFPCPDAKKRGWKCSCLHLPPLNYPNVGKLDHTWSICGMILISQNFEGLFIFICILYS